MALRLGTQAEAAVLEVQPRLPGLGLWIGRVDRRHPIDNGRGVRSAAHEAIRDAEQPESVEVGGVNLQRSLEAPDRLLLVPSITQPESSGRSMRSASNGLRIPISCRISQGLQINADYASGEKHQYDFYSFQVPCAERIQSYTNSAAASGDINHSPSATWVCELPCG